MSKEPPLIDFPSIRPLAGESRKEGFEELTTQIFRNELRNDGNFYRVEGVGGDGGVEAFIQRPDGSIIGFQSKFWTKIGDSQWNQLTKSVKSAIKNHSKLSRYIVATPRNRNPTQIKKWNALKIEWNSHAKSVGHTSMIDFEWWGNSELSSYLSKQEYRDHLTYWFGVPEFSVKWIHSKNDITVQQLEKRYSPTLHINTISGQKLEAFAESGGTRKTIVAEFVAVAERWKKMAPNFGARTFPDDDITQAQSEIVRFMAEIEAFRWPHEGFAAIRPLLSFSHKALDATNSIQWKLEEFSSESRRLKSDDPKEKTQKFDFLIHSLSGLADSLQDLITALRISQYADETKVLLFGEAGNGKSHLIAELVRAATLRDQVALHLLGESFINPSEPWKQAVENLGWSYQPEDLFAALEQEAIIRGKPSLVCIDALNESDHRSLWKIHILSFAARLKDYKNVKLLISCRSDFLPITLPDTIWEDRESKWPQIEHEGYGSEVFEAVETYFREFKVSARYFPPVLEEFSNPLFLRTFCEAFEGQEIPEGPITLSRVMKARIEKLCTQIQKDIDCDPADTRAALKLVTAEFAANGGRAVDGDRIRSLVNSYSPSNESSKSLYRRLVSNGILVEQVRFSPDSPDPALRVRFPFERFSDYLIAQNILDQADTPSAFTDLFKSKGTLNHLLDYSSYWSNRGMARALAILVPEKFSSELVEFLPKNGIDDSFLEDFLASFAWRAASSFSENTKKFLREAQESGLDLIGALLRVSTVPGHPYNAKHLSERLIGLNLPDRELLWTIPVASESGYDDGGLPSRIVEWCFKVPESLVSDEQAELVGHLLLWFCSSNHQALRLRSTLAAIKVLRNRPKVVIKLLKAFGKVNDPYVIEKLYAVAAGVTLRANKGYDLAQLGQTVYDQVFSSARIPPNIVVRDYAASTLESLAARGILPKAIETSSFRPPFKSKWPKILSDKAIEPLERDESWRQILSSVKTESMGHYGDFGRYVMGTAVHEFSDILRSAPKPDPKYRNNFKATTARRWVLQRVKELGWSGDDFREYESSLPARGRQRHDIEKLRLERISKKFQWIALHELQGYLSDHYWLAPSWGNGTEDYRGAWQIWGRKFDPSQRLLDPLAPTDEESEEAPWKSCYPDPFKDNNLCIDREAWVTKTPEDFAVLIEPTKPALGDGNRWITIAGHYAWEEPKYDLLARGSKGVLKMWADIRTYLVPKAELKNFVQRIQGKNFWGSGIDLPEQHEGWIGEYP